MHLTSWTVRSRSWYEGEPVRFRGMPGASRDHRRRTHVHRHGSRAPLFIYLLADQRPSSRLLPCRCRAGALPRNGTTALNVPGERCFEFGSKLGMSVDHVRLLLGISLEVIE